MAKNILICDDAAFMRMMIKDIQKRLHSCRRSRERRKGSGEVF